MHTYELLYKARGTEMVPLDLGDERPAMNYQVSTLNELKDRQASFSQAVKLPKTRRNLQALGFLDMLEVRAVAAYTPQVCELLCDGAVLSPFGSLLYVDSVDEAADGTINCQIVSGTADLFSKLGEVDNDHMSGWPSVWSSEQVTKDNNYAYPGRKWVRVYPNADKRDWWYPDMTGETVESLHLLEMVPCYNYHTLIQQLLSKYNYMLESDIDKTDLAKNLHVTASKITLPANDSATFEEKNLTLPVDPNSSKGYYAYGISPNPTCSDYNSRVEFVSVGSGPSDRRMFFYAMQDGDYDVHFEIRNRQGGVPFSSNKWLRVTCFVKGSAVIGPTTVKDLPDFAVFPMWYDRISLKRGESLSLQVTPSTGVIRDPTFIDISWTVKLVEDHEDPGVGSKFDFMQATGFKSYKEALLSYIQLFGALVDIKRRQPSSSDQTEGTVRIYTFEELYRRRDAGKFVDWSRKLVMGQDRVSKFAVGSYAQRNIIKFEESKSLGINDQAALTIDNKTLDAEKNLFTIAVEAGRNATAYYVYKDGTRRTRSMAQVPTLEIESTGVYDEPQKMEYKGCKAHLVRLTGETLTVRNKSGFLGKDDKSMITWQLPVAVNVPLSTFVGGFYPRLEDILRNARTLSAFFMLDVVDIEALDFFTPVYVEHYGAYFYIEKINGFVAGKPTRVDLVRL